MPKKAKSPLQKKTTRAKASAKSKVTRKTAQNDRRKEFLTVFASKFCNVKNTCEAVGITRKTYYEWRNTSDDFAEAADDIIEGLKDDIESVMYTKVLVEQDTRAVIHAAESKLKDRGWARRTELEHSGDAPVTSVKVNFVGKGKKQ